MKKSDFETLLHQFSDVVKDSQVILSSSTQEEILFKARIWFIDSSKLAVTDHFFNISRRKYAYQWMKEDNSLIIRWDNVKHHPDIENFPFHKHIETDENVHSSEEMDLKTVLAYIAEQLK
ncbi:MAG: hypothetical protein F6K17_09505 [Okeania sp. SIO3C4]|nr:hypothetical protein [Okeania sp. SIO3C4]